MDVHDLIIARVSIKKDNYSENGGSWVLCQSRLYYKFQSAMQDVINGSSELFDGIPEKYLPEKFDQPQIRYSGVDVETNRPTDFEFRYCPKGDYNFKLCVFIGTVMIEDEPIK